MIVSVLIVCIESVLTVFVKAAINVVVRFFIRTVVFHQGHSMEEEEETVALPGAGPVAPFGPVATILSLNFWVSRVSVSLSLPRSSLTYTYIYRFIL